jgi:hypothetical protein
LAAAKKLGFVNCALVPVPSATPAAVLLPKRVLTEQVNWARALLGSWQASRSSSSVAGAEAIGTRDGEEERGETSHYFGNKITARSSRACYNSI